MKDEKNTITFNFKSAQEEIESKLGIEILSKIDDDIEKEKLELDSLLKKRNILIPISVAVFICFVVSLINVDYSSVAIFVLLLLVLRNLNRYTNKIKLSKWFIFQLDNTRCKIMSSNKK